MNYAPVIIPTFCRFELFKNCIESLKKNPWAKFTDLYIGVDYTEDERYKSGNEKIKEYVRSGIEGFGEVHIYIREENFGVERNLAELKAEAEKKFDRYIVSEDDNIFSPCFLEFVDKALEYSEKDDSVFAVCGFSYPISYRDDASLGVIKEQSFFSVWGYGILVDRAHKFESDMTDRYFTDKLKDRAVVKKIKRSSKLNYCSLIDLAYKKRSFHHDVAKSLYMNFENLFCLMPTQSFVKNCGWDGSGIHCAKDIYGFSGQVISEEESFPAELKDIFINHYSDNEIRVSKFLKPQKKQRIKSTIKRIIMFFGIK